VRLETGWSGAGGERRGGVVRRGAEGSGRSAGGEGTGLGVDGIGTNGGEETSRLETLSSRTTLISIAFFLPFKSLPVIAPSFSLSLPFTLP
jgi:hypothetical protein